LALVAVLVSVVMIRFLVLWFPNGKRQAVILLFYFFVWFDFDFDFFDFFRVDQSKHDDEMPTGSDPGAHHCIASCLAAFGGLT
jgi:hypothetical protein